ncbi:TPA: hypothetical protein ACQMG9_001542 [Streptococcus pyogenes]
MKTKSKRFLNLATLCLALLGTTLLTTQPVKADGTGADYVSGYEGPYYQGRNKGKEDGYRAGNYKGAPDDPGSHTPPVDPYSSDRQNSYLYRSGYGEGYTQGYYEGWHKANDPVTEGQNNLEGSSDDSNDSRRLESQVDDENPMNMSELSILDLVYGMVKGFWGYMLDVFAGNVK